MLRPMSEARFEAFTLAELDAVCKALYDLKRKLEGDAYSLTVARLLVAAGEAWRAAYASATSDERLAVERRIAGDSGLTSLEFRSGLKGLKFDDVDDDELAP